MKNRDKFYYPAWKHALPIAVVVGLAVSGFTYLLQPEYTIYVGLLAAVVAFTVEYRGWNKVLDAESDD